MKTKIAGVGIIVIILIELAVSLWINSWFKPEKKLVQTKVENVPDKKNFPANKFQLLLNSKCKINSENVFNLYNIKLGDLPVKFNLTPKHKFTTIRCLGEYHNDITGKNEPNKRFIWISYKDPYYFIPDNQPWNSLEIYDENAYQGRFKRDNFVTFYNHNDVKFSGIIDYAGDGGFYHSWLTIRGERVVNYGKDKKLFVRIEERFDYVGSDDDPLEKKIPRDLYKKGEEAKFVVDRFLSKDSVLLFFDLLRIRYMEKVLNSISVKDVI
ncbi:hypothetical protein C4577_06860 [Candidatus Parcubacteria bacterium]|nr:MAG: hypothetical protein C4577_06860 [Candidatus Parcubacteria bacterium]